MARRGAFIVVEGLDRSGKTTQVDALHARLQAEGVPMLDAYLRSQSTLDNRAVHLLFSANRWEQARTIQLLLAEGTTVLCDRYAFSGVAFSAAKGLPLDWCRSPDVSLPAPDLTLFLDIAPEKARERGGYGAERYETEELQRRVRDIFRQLSGEVDQAKWVTVDAGRARDEVAADVWDAMRPLTADGGLAVRLQRLWEGDDE
ncbi:thymidylate kinase [Mycena latifolia]|nr:thymidylate kinase [Mycena latifolia]